MVTIVLITALIALAFSFTNGMNDAANCIATVVATKALPPKTAVYWAAFWIIVAGFVFYFILGMNVASTMGKGIVFEGCLDVYVILAALAGSVLWIFVCTKFGLPISASHALIGGLIGPVWFVYGSEFLGMHDIILVVAFIAIAPLIGMVMGFFMNCLFMLIFKNSRARRVDKGFRRCQLLSSAAFSFGFGANDGQKTLGIIVVLLANAIKVEPDNVVLNFLYGDGVYKVGGIPLWVMIACYGLITIGAVTGGWKVIRTLGDGITKIGPAQGFCSEASGAFTLILSAVAGIPVSTTHTITGSIIGTGLTRGVKSVKWVTAKNIVSAWVLTIPAVIVVSGLIYMLMTAIWPEIILTPVR